MRGSGRGWGSEMPAFLHGKADEERWAEATRQAIAQRARDARKGKRPKSKSKWPLVNYIFWQMKGAVAR